MHLSANYVLFFISTLFSCLIGNATVCGQHFDDDCFDIEVTMNEENTETRTRTVLKDDAIPTLQLNEFVNL